MAKGYKTPGSGRKKGTLNRATVERRVAAEIDSARQAGRELAKDVLERAMQFAETQTGLYRTISEDQAAALRAAGEDRARAQTGDPDKMGQWFDRWTYCAKELAQYQSPKLRAIAIAPVPAEPSISDRVKIVRLTVFEGGRALPAPDDEAA